MPSSKVKVTLKTSLGTWRGSSDVLRECFEDKTKTIPSGNYGDARKHSTKAAREIIRDASAAIETKFGKLQWPNTEQVCGQC